VGAPQSERELFVNDYRAILSIGRLGSSHMLTLKVPAAIAAFLLLSSVSAQAMEFADRRGPISETFTSAPTVRGVQSEERLRRQINNHNILQPGSVEWMNLVDRPRPISNLNRVWVVQMTVQNRPGRLSAEFSPVARSSRINFEYGPGEVSSWLRPTASPIAMTFDYHPGPIGNLFPLLVGENIKFADRGFTSSLTKTNIPSEIAPGKGSAGFCVGSMAPCGSLNFAEMGISSAAYQDERL
jgi:hypothetical protein